MMPLSRWLSSVHLISLKTISPCMPSKRRSHTPSERRSGPNHGPQSKSVEGGIALPPFEQELIKAPIELNTPIQETMDAVHWCRRTVFKQNLKVLIVVFHRESQTTETYCKNSWFRDFKNCQRAESTSVASRCIK